MNGFDLALLILVAVLVIVGLVKGLVRVLVGILALVTAFLVASRFHGPLAERARGVDVSPEVLQLVAYLLLFVAVMLAGGVVAWLLRKLVKAAMLGWADRLAGAALGLAAALFAAALIVLPVVAYAPGGSELLGRSRLAPYVDVVADVLASTAPPELASAYRRHVEALRRIWHGLEPSSTSTIGEARRS